MKSIIKVVFAALCIGLMLTACGEEEKVAVSNIIVADAKLTEEGQTLNPNDLVHVTGTGFQEGDYIVLSVTWDTGDEKLPEGKIVSYVNTYESKTSGGISFRVPYRYPAGKMEVILHRDGNNQSIGSANLTNGVPPTDYRLYALDEDGKTISRLKYSDTLSYQYAAWAADGYTDIRSIASYPSTYTLCAIAKKGDTQTLAYMDFCMDVWSDMQVGTPLAFITNPDALFCLTTDNGTGYLLKDLTAYLPHSYSYTVATKAAKALATRTSVVVPPKTYPLPDGLTASMFGDYPGVQTQSAFLLSANKGNGKWVPVFFVPTTDGGFAAGDEIEAERLIPFCFFRKGNDGNYVRRCGLATSYASGGSELLLLDESATPVKFKSIAQFDMPLLSVAYHREREDYLSILFQDDATGKTCSLLEYSEGSTDNYILRSQPMCKQVVWGN